MSRRDENIAVPATFQTLSTPIRRNTHDMYVWIQNKQQIPFHRITTGVIALLDFDFLGDFRRFSRRFSQKSRRYFFFKRNNASIIKYCTMKMNLPNFLPQQDVLLYSCPQLQSRYYIHTMHYPMSEGMSQIIIQF